MDALRGNALALPPFRPQAIQSFHFYFPSFPIALEGPLQRGTRY